MSSTLTHWYYHESNDILKFTLPTIQATHEVLENGLKPCGDIFISTSLIFSITCKQYLVVRPPAAIALASSFNKYYALRKVLWCP